MSEKVSALTAILGVDVSDSDILYIVDVSAGTSGSRKILVSEFAAKLQTFITGLPQADSVALVDASPVVIASLATSTYAGFKLIVVLTDGTNKEIWTIDGVILAASVPLTTYGGAGNANRGHTFDSQINGANAEVRCTANGSGWTAKTLLLRVPS